MFAQTQNINPLKLHELKLPKKGKTMSFKDITLEVSLKPFKKTDEKYIKKVCRQIFTQWYPLIKDRETVSVMLWGADGSEILDYGGELSAPFEWACYMGTANLPMADDNDALERSLHEKKRYYIDEPPVMTYGVLKNIVSAIKEVGKEFLPDAEILVGETFDIGPEFAISDFKYNRHPEVCSGTGNCDKIGIIDSTAVLDADDFHYAAYPDGVPAGTVFGTFFGKQAKIFLSDMGFDYIWLSNGLGFSSNPWELTGKIFDGKKFHPEKLGATRKRVFDFWRLFSAECDIQIRTRGTNNSVGIDYASDGVPLYDIYRGGFNILPPPNSPWAALNDNFGLEIMGHMTRIAELPGDDFMFRYYIHDPWWRNTPWYDRYDSCPTDIYLPMAIGRVDENGKVRSAGYFNILSIDNTFGDMPDHCVNEPLPHILKAEKDAPDDLAPFVWLYPVKEFTAASDEKTLAEMYHGDNFICDEINNGLPLNCVVSTDNFLKLGAEYFRKTVLISPLPQTEEVKDALCSYAENGGRVLIYGSEKPDGISENILFVAVSDGLGALREALAEFDYEIKFVTIHQVKKLPTMTVYRSDNGYFFSVYNCDTTTEAYLKFPLGAPILKTGETELVDGYARLNFPRWEHRECRVFVQQKEGVISCREVACVNARFRRRIYMEGLDDATVCYFPEAYCQDKAYFEYIDETTDTFDRTPKLEDVFVRIEDPEIGVYFKAEHISGSVALLMEFPK